MFEHCFSFLDAEFPNISNHCESCEKQLVEKNFIASVAEAGIACEDITKYVANFIGKPEYNELKQYKRLNKLSRYYNLIPPIVLQNFHKIRKVRNDVLHNNLNPTEDFSYQMHKRLYSICVWFYNQYGHGENISSEYTGPIYSMEEIDEGQITDKIDDVTTRVTHTQVEIEKLREELQRLKEGQQETNTPEETGQQEIETSKENDKLSHYEFDLYHDSYLLNELSKLNISSSQSVENEENLNEFKTYIHVERSIQKEFIEELKRVVNEDSSHLVMLCGNVGDGKSHLLAYTKTHYPDLYTKFTINGDATQSYFTTKTEVDTLANELVSFKDENIDKSSEKFILAINLGVLNNFIDSEYCNKDYTKLKKIIEEANLFDSDIISQNLIQDKVSFITFTDYNLFELNGDSDTNYVSSNYIISLLKKITSPHELNNPFYRAYLMDKEKGINSPIIYNYEMLCDDDVQKVLVEYIIRVFVEQKKIISTRDLFNTIYELLVPSEIMNYSKEDSIDDFVDYLLPNMLFNNTGRSKLLNFLSYYDPTKVRNEELDDFIIKFNITSDLSKIIQEEFNTAKLELFKDYFEYYSDLSECSYSGKLTLIKTLIRLAVFYGKNEFKQCFIEENYLNYLKYLYFYNCQNRSGYNSLFTDIKKAIFELKGSIKKDYICIDELDSYKVSKELKLKPHNDYFDIIGDELSNRFKTSIKIYFSVHPNKEKIPLEVDYPLYSAICKLKEGYKPNKVEKEKLVLFEEFINTLINQSPSDYLLITDTEHEEDFTFEYDEDELDEKYDTFTFDKGG